MVAVFLRAALVLLVGAVLAFILVSPPARRRVQSLASVGTGAFLLVLVGCSPSLSPSSTPPPTIIPQTLPPSTATPTGSTSNSTDWTTYHRDNMRTGYLANMPDPQQLT